jgi:uncharacterized protein (DUF58 family)
MRSVARPGPCPRARELTAGPTAAQNRRGLVIFISDLLFDQDLALRALQFLRHRGHQVLVFHLMDPAELELEGPPEVRFEDPESGQTVVVRPREFRAAYREAVRRSVTAWRGACRRSGISYLHVRTDTPFGHVLRRAAERRARLG